VVRSKGETDEKVKLAPKIRALEKFCPISLHEIEQALRTNGGKVEFRWNETIIDDAGQSVDVLIRLNLNCKSAKSSGWTASLKIGKSNRIDCVDFEGGTGWHRHDFSEEQQSAERSKSSITGFHDHLTQAEFLVRALKLMKIAVNKHSDGILPFDPGSADSGF